MHGRTFFSFLFFFIFAFQIDQRLLGTAYSRSDIKRIEKGVFRTNSNSQTTKKDSIDSFRNSYWISLTSADLTRKCPKSRKRSGLLKVKFSEQLDVSKMTQPHKQVKIKVTDTKLSQNTSLKKNAVPRDRKRYPRSVSLGSGDLPNDRDNKTGNSTLICHGKLCRPSADLTRKSPKSRKPSGLMKLKFSEQLHATRITTEPHLQLTLKITNATLTQNTSLKKNAVHRDRKRYPRSLSLGSGDLPNDRDNKTGNSTLICHGELSCRDKCHNPRTVLYQTKLSCYCDVDCEFFQDCCADYDNFCATNPRNTTVNGQDTTHNTGQENLVNQQNRDLWRCYEGEKLLGTKGVWMIGSCPKVWPKDHVFYQCRKLSEANTITKDNYRYLPVYTDNGRVYHNRFCAVCNGVSSKDMRDFSLSIQCQFSPPRHLSFEEKIQFLFRYCSDKMKWKGIEGQPRRYCIDFAKIETQQSNNSDLRNKCIHGKPRIVSTGKENYKHSDCAKYVSEINVHISCGPNISRDTEGPKIKPMSLSIIFNFNNEAESSFMKIKTTCDENKVYDPYLETCRDGIPPALLSSSYSNRYHVLLWLHPVEKLPSCFLHKNLVYRAIVRTFGISPQKVKNVIAICFKNPIKYKVQFTLEITQEERAKESMKQMLDYTSPFNVTIAKLLFTVVKATKRILSCFHWQKYDRNEYTVLQDGTSAVSIKKTGVIFKSTDYYINTTSTANESQAIFVCHQHQLSNCSGVFILLNSSEFTLLHNKSIFVNASKQFYDWSEYIWQNNSVLVCENFSKYYYETKIESNDDALLRMMTIVCMSLSITGLVFVLVTYSLFSELRTPPGINLMNLSVSILFPQLLWLLGSGHIDIPTVCTVIAVILHYLFLVSFMWTSIIAFNTWRAFSAKGRPFANSRHERMRQCLRYMVVGWLPLMMYVAICVVLDFTDTVDIGYTSKRACWMGNRWAILYFFAVPISSFLVFNIVFCFITFRAIDVTTAQARAASHHDTRKNFGIYLRIASLMGFTWIFGFAAPFVGQFLWYPFVILNSLQGVYIAMAFALNKRARSLYKRLFTGGSSSDESSNTSILRTRTKGSEYTNEGCDESRF